MANDSFNIKPPLDAAQSSVKQPQAPAAQAFVPPAPATQSQPGITSANLPQQPAQAKAAPDIENIIARPLVDADFTKLKPKNPNVAFYWANRVADRGHRVEDLRARGFEIATEQDVEIKKDNIMLKNGQIVRGDLILMKIDRVKYLGQLKYNRESADARVSRAANSARGRDELGSALREVGGLPQRYRGKIAIYSPNPTDVENS